MAIQSGFFNSVNGDRRYDAKWFAQYFASFIGNGVFPNPSTGLQVVEGDNMTTVVKAGKGWINGYFIVNDSDYILQHDNADGVLKRIDRVVMRLNNLTRQIEIAVKRGNFASSPVAPFLQRDGDYYELALADILINNGSTQITQANITDTRLNKELCGIVHGLVDQVDTTTVFNQYQAWLEKQAIVMDEWQRQEKGDFQAWFDALNIILDGDVATNLANQIFQLRTETETNFGKVEDAFRIKTNVTVNSTSWKADNEMFYYDITDTDITSDSIVNVNIHLNSLEAAATLKSATESFEGYARLYASEPPSVNLIADITISREVTV